MFRPRHILIFMFFVYICEIDALKCRSGEEPQPNEDFEYVVRVCLTRQMRNNSDFFSDSNDRNQYGYDFDRNRRYKDRMGSYYNNKYRGSSSRNRDRNGSDGFDRFWGPNGKSNERDRDRDRDRDRMEDEYSDEFGDYGPLNPNRMNKNRKKVMLRVPQPHTFQQQVQHDRDMLYGYGNRESQYYYHGNRNKNSRRPSNNDQKNESPLEQIDACVIHCIFQELQMLDESGKPDKSTVSIRMSQKIRNSELKSFIQDAVDECFDVVDAEESNTRYRGSDYACMWSKNFAICLEDKGRQACEDWNDPIQYNSNSKSRDDQKDKQRGGKGNRG